MNTQSHNSSWAWFGLIAVIVGYVATWATVFLVSDANMKLGGEALIADIESGNDQAIFRITTGLGLPAAASLAVYAAGIRRALRDAIPGDSIVPAIISYAFLGTAALLAVGFIFRGMVFDSQGSYGDDPRIALYVVGIDLPLAAWGLLGIAAAASAYASLAMHVLPKWFGVFSAICAVLVAAIWMTGTPPPANIPMAPWLISSIVAFRGLGRETTAQAPAALPATA